MATSWILATATWTETSQLLLDSWDWLFGEAELSRDWLSESEWSQPSAFTADVLRGFIRNVVIFFVSYRDNLPSFVVQC